MADKPLSVRLPLDLDEYVRSLPNRTEWLREAVAEKRQREKGLQDNKEQLSPQITGLSSSGESP